MNLRPRWGDEMMFVICQRQEVSRMERMFFEIVNNVNLVESKKDVPWISLMSLIFSAWNQSQERRKRDLKVKEYLGSRIFKQIWEDVSIENQSRVTFWWGKPFCKASNCLCRKRRILSGSFIDFSDNKFVVQSQWRLWQLTTICYQNLENPHVFVYMKWPGI